VNVMALCGNMRITLERRPDDYHAHFELGAQRFFVEAPTAAGALYKAGEIIDSCESTASDYTTEEP
jgi:hypothetical protein